MSEGLGSRGHRPSVLQGISTCPPYWTWTCNVSTHANSSQVATMAKLVQSQVAFSGFFNCGISIFFLLEDLGCMIINLLRCFDSSIIHTCLYCCTWPLQASLFSFMEVLAIDLLVTSLNVVWAVHEQLRQSNESTWWKVQLLKLIKADSVFHQWNRQGRPHVLQPFLSFLGKFLVSLQLKLGNLSVVTITKSGLYSFQEFLSLLW